MGPFVVLSKFFFLSIVCISGSGLKYSKPCSRPWPSGPSAWHKPGDNQKQSEGTEPWTATVPYTAHEGFSQTGGRASRRQPVIMEIVRCDDSGMLIACFFFLFEWRQHQPTLLRTLPVCRGMKKGRSINAMKHLRAEIKCFVFCSCSDEQLVLMIDADADNRLTPRMWEILRTPLAKTHKRAKCV